MVIRAFGVEGLRERIREHVALARWLAGEIAGTPGFELAAPAPFSTVCFRALPKEAGAHERSDAGADRLNERLLAAVNAEGPFLLSHTVLRGRYVLRVAIGNLRTERRHVEALWDLVRRRVAALGAGGS